VITDKIFVVVIVISVLFSHSVETITIGDKKISIHTSVLEEKTTACNMLCCYVDELKEGFFPWIDLVNILHYVVSPLGIEHCDELRC